MPEHSVSFLFKHMQWTYVNVQYYLFCVSDIRGDGRKSEEILFLTAIHSFSSYIRIQRWVNTLCFALCSYVSITQIVSCVVHMVWPQIFFFPLASLALLTAASQSWSRAFIHSDYFPFLSSFLLDPEQKWPSSVVLQARTPGYCIETIRDRYS